MEHALISLLASSGLLVSHQRHHFFCGVGHQLVSRELHYCRLLISSSSGLQASLLIISTFYIHYCIFQNIHFHYHVLTKENKNTTCIKKMYNSDKNTSTNSFIGSVICNK